MSPADKPDTSWYTGFHGWLRLHCCARATVAKSLRRKGCCMKRVFEKGGPSQLRGRLPRISNFRFWAFLSLYPTVVDPNISEWRSFGHGSDISQFEFFVVDLINCCGLPTFEVNVSRDLLSAQVSF